MPGAVRSAVRPQFNIGFPNSFDGTGKAYNYQKANRPFGYGVAVRFHFQVRTGTHVMVTEAADFSNSDEARIEAAKRIGLLLHAHAVKLWVDEDWRMDVTDDGSNSFRDKRFCH